MLRQLAGLDIENLYMEGVFSSVCTKTKILNLIDISIKQ